MSLAFPAIRAVGWGGRRTLREGGKMFKDSYFPTDYKKIANTKGGGTLLAGLARLSAGADNTILAQSRHKVSSIMQFASGQKGEGWKRIAKDGIKLSDTEKIRHLGEKNPEALADLMHSVQREVGKGFGKWGGAWLKDMAGSMPRMAIK